MTLKVAIECVERKQMCNKEDIRDCYAKECDKCEYSVSHDAFIMALDVILNVLTITKKTERKINERTG